MNVRSAAAGVLLVLAWSACSATKTEAPHTGSAPAQAAKEVCKHDEDCAPFHRCTSDHRCRCELDEDCAASQHCRAGVCLHR